MANNISHMILLWVRTNDQDFWVGCLNISSNDWVLLTRFRHKLVRSNTIIVFTDWKRRIHSKTLSRVWKFKNGTFSYHCVRWAKTHRRKPTNRAALAWKGPFASVQFYWRGNNTVLTIYELKKTVCFQHSDKFTITFKWYFWPGMKLIGENSKLYWISPEP